MPKTISQKKFVRGINAATGLLSQQEGALTRASNMLLTQRGSLQVCDGSSSIGQLPSPFTNPAAIGPFVAFGSGQYPLYAVLANPSSQILADVTGLAGTLTGSSGNPAGNYYFAVVALGDSSGIHSNGLANLLEIGTSSAFAGINFSWNAVPGAVSYAIYYLQFGTSAVGQLLASGISMNSYDWTGTLSPGTTPIPTPNSSYVLQLLIGSVTPPSQVVGFTPVTNGQFPGTAPQPAQLAPGDPKFVFGPITGTPVTYTPSSAPTTVTAIANQDSSPETNSILINGWPSLALSTGATVMLNIGVSGNGGVTQRLGTGGSISATYSYSPDGGSTWFVFYSQFYTGAATTWNQQLSIALPTTLANLNNLQVKISVTSIFEAEEGEFGQASVTANDSSPNVTTTVFSSFSPYGGISGVTGVLPDLLQFANQEILILGNGYAPQTCDPSDLASADPVALNNTFQASYPTWQSGVSWISGAQLSALDGSTNYLFTATQGGVSGTSAPTWNFTQGQETADGSVIWTCNGPIASTVAPRGAAHGLVYAGSLWLANTSPSTTSDQLDGPTVLKMSDSNNPNSWNPVNTAFIGRDDGTQITGMASFTIAALGISPTGSMAVFKEFLTYQIIGVFGSNDFEIQEAQTNMGCIAARSIQFIPGFGVVRFSHLGFAVYDGVNDRLISEEIRPYLFGGIGMDSSIVPVDPTYLYLSRSAQSVLPPMYLCAMPLQGANGQMTRVFCYDLIVKAWVIIDLPWPVSCLARVSIGEGYPLVLSGKGDGTIQRLQTGDTAWDATNSNQAITWSFRTADLFGQGGSQRLFFREAVIRGWATPAQAASIVVTPTIDGSERPALAFDVTPMASNSSQFEIRASIFANGQLAHLDVSGTGQLVVDSIDWTVEPKSASARRVIG